MAMTMLTIVWWLMAVAFVGLLALLALAPFWPRLARWFANGQDIDA